MPVTRFVQPLVAGVTCLVLAGCATTATELQQAHENARPRSTPVRNITGFTESLRCMDRLLARYIPPGPPAILYSKGVVDKTGKNLGYDNREMLMSTISKMSAGSNIFQVTDLPTNLDDAGVIEYNFGLDNRARAQYEIIAAISQMDENVSARSRGFSITLPNFDISAAEDINVTVISVDFLVSKPSSGLVQNGIDASNAIAIARVGKAGDIGGQIKKSGFYFNLALDRSEGLYAAIRALVELSTIEVLGKLAEVPYWQCLQIEQTHPEVLSITNQWFNRMGTRQRIIFVQTMLARRGLYAGATTGKLDALTRDAIARYQQAVGLIPSGRIDLALYRSLIGDDVGDRVRLATAQPAASSGEAPAAATVSAVKPTLTLTTDRGPRPRYAVREQLKLIAAVSQPAYLHCFYRDADGQIVKIYPNRFQPAGRIAPSAPLMIPGAPQFSLLLDKPGSREEVACLASPTYLDGQLPAELAPDLQPLPVASLDEVIGVFERLDPRTLARHRLTIDVN